MFRMVVASFAMLLVAPMMAGGRGGKSTPRPYYGGGSHSESHGGRYVGGSGSSHRGGHYLNPRSGNQYGKHKY